MAELENKRPNRKSRALWATAIVAVLGVGVVLALPGPPPRQYPERIPVRFWHMWTAEWKDVVDDIVERFNESQNVYEVIPLSIPYTAADSKFLLSVAGGDPPDVMAQWNAVIPKWADNDLIIPLDDLMTPEEWEEFQNTVYPVAQKIGLYKGRLYGVTTGLNIRANYIRLDHLREAGLAPDDIPETLEELCAWSEQLHRFNDSGDVVRIGFLPQNLYDYAPAFGGGFYDWETNEVLIDTPENRAALEFLVAERRKLGFEKVVRFISGLAVGLGNVEWPFISGSYTIVADGQWRVEQLRKYAPELEYITRPIPPPKGGNEHAGWVNGNFMIIPRGAQCVEGAWEFIKFWSGLENPERAAEFYTWGGWLPLRPAIAEAPIFRKYVEEYPQFQTFLDMLPSENMYAMPPVPYQVFLWDRLIQADEAAMRGTLTAPEALARLEREVARELTARKELGYDE